MSFEIEGASEGYRAIGRWLVQFSRLIGGMRTNMEARLRRPDDDPALVGLAFGAAPAGQIADAFFGMCRLVGGLDDAETNVANQLALEVDHAITMRNKIAHGDWIVGRSGDSAQDEIEVHLARVRPKARKGSARRVDTLTAADFDGLSDRLGVLGGLVYLFGRLALGLPTVTVSGEAPAGTYRVSDVLNAVNVPKGGKGGEVVRRGPRTSELL